MPTPQPDLRSERRKALDEQLASEPQLPLPDVLPASRRAPWRRIFATVAPWPLSGWWRTGWCACSTRE
ncbi:MAG: hypothetical protein ACLQU5_14590 [Isosphaeraceae bacterium]